MPKRDWQKDWKICEEATSGVWEIYRPWGKNTEDEDVWNVETDDDIVALGCKYRNALFISEAREGWPAALKERARLEKRVRELEEEVKVLTAKVVALQENHTLFEKIIQRVQAICDIYKMCEQPETEAKPFIKELNKLLEEWENAPIEF